MKPVDTPMGIKLSVWDGSGEFFENKAKYRRLVGKFIYLNVTRPKISFADLQLEWSVVSRISLSMFTGMLLSEF